MNAGVGAGADSLCPPADAIFDPPQYVVNNVYHQQVQPIVHTIEYINQHHCVPVPHHIYTCKTKDVMCSSVRNRRSKKSKKR
ncbi:hypothetical protein EBB07_26935 [Paenibacillaceae bacterium]|nr:hypothetical protein EBB07_26935 [Paenibacillaceae bacterium]